MRANGEACRPPWETAPVVDARDASLAVTGSNLQRRHMDERQRALAAAMLAKPERAASIGCRHGRTGRAEADETASGKGRLVRT